MFYVDTFVLPAVFLDGLARLESLLLAVLVLDGRHAKFLADFKRNEKCFGFKSFHCFLFYHSFHFRFELFLHFQLSMLSVQQVKFLVAKNSIVHLLIGIFCKFICYLRNGKIPFNQITTFIPIQFHYLIIVLLV